MFRILEIKLELETENRIANHLQRSTGSNEEAIFSRKCMDRDKVLLIALPYAFENAIKQFLVGTHGLLLIVIEMSNYKGAYARV